jgi:NAD+ synthase
VERANRTSVQAAISAELMVPAEFDAAVEVERRVTFLVEQLAGSGLRGWVLGVSGGVDSATAARLCQLAAERVRADGGTATFVAMRLPYRAQADEEDAQRARAFIRPEYDAHRRARAARRGYRPRRGGRHGLFTKYGDGACDLAPLAGLTKRRVRAVAQALGAEDAIVAKVPTADLESERPGLPDEHVFGVTYERIDDFLEGREVAPEVHEIIVSTYRRTAHKRALPATP